MAAPSFPCFIKKTQINPEYFNFSVYQGWDNVCDQSVVCQDISKVPCFLNNTTDISVVMGINTTTSALSYKHAFMAMWLEWWTVVAS